jgi:hypothetical protein
MIDGLCQAYHWTLPEAMKLTLPQILLFNHAASVNGRRMDNKQEARKKQDETSKSRNEKDPIVYNGKRLSQLTDDEQEAYYGGGFTI